MALDIHRLENGKPAQRLLSISDAAFETLAPGFRLFHQRTGIVLDQYKDQKFSSGLAPLIESLQDTMSSNPQQAKIFRELLHVLISAQANGNALIFVGD